ncbi:MAG: recombinase family protein [Faecalibacterium prausnitzii]
MKSHSDGYLTQKRIKNLDESSYIYVKGDFEPLVSEEMWERCQQILASRSARVIDETGKKHKYMRNTPKSVWTAKLRCSCGAGFIQFKWRVNRDGAVIHGFQCYRRTRRPSISYLQEHGLDLSISCQIKAISEWKLDLMAAKVFEHLTFDKGKTVKEVYRILSRCMAEEKTVRISRKAMLEKSIAKQRERLDKYIDLCADGIITKQELAERRKGLDAQIAELQSQYENVEQEDERSGTLDMNLIAQKLDEWQKASRNDVNRELINSCVAQITPLTNEDYRWVLDFQLTEVQSGNSATCMLDGFMEMARFTDFILKKQRLLRLPEIRDPQKMNGRISRWLWESGRKRRSRRLCRLCRSCQRFSNSFIISYISTRKTPERQWTHLVQVEAYLKQI